MSGFPKMLYKKGGPALIHGVDCDTLVVNDEAEEQAAAGDGFGRYESMFGGQTVAMPTPVSDTDADQRLADANRQLEEARSDLQAAAELLEEERSARTAAEAERDEANEKMADLKASFTAFDRDQDGKPGGSKPAADRTTLSVSDKPKGTGKKD